MGHVIYLHCTYWGSEKQSNLHKETVDDGAGSLTLPLIDLAAKVLHISHEEAWSSNGIIASKSHTPVKGITEIFHNLSGTHIYQTDYWHYHNLTTSLYWFSSWVRGHWTVTNFHFWSINSDPSLSRTEAREIYRTVLDWFCSSRKSQHQVNLTPSRLSLSAQKLASLCYRSPISFTHEFL